MAGVSIAQHSARCAMENRSLTSNKKYAKL